MCANCDFCENIAWVFGVNWVFGAFLIYPIYPKNPKYYFFVFSSPFKQQFRITNSFSFDYADLPYHLITSSPPSYGLPADTFSAPSKSPQKSSAWLFSPENQCSILNYADGVLVYHKWKNKEPPGGSTCGSDVKQKTPEVQNYGHGVNLFISSILLRVWRGGQRCRPLM